MTTATRLTILAALAALAACNGASSPREDRDGAADPAVTTAPEPEPTASILRPDIEPPEQEMEAIAPIEVTVTFPDGGAQLDEAAVDALEALLETEQVRQGWPIVLRGHSDSGGSDAANQLVSRRRAEVVREWLIGQGLAEDRIGEVIAFGEQNPVAPNARPDGSPDEHGRAANRRVEIVVAPPRADEPASDASGEAGE